MTVADNHLNVQELKPYAPSWVDVLIAWIARSPLPAWAIYAGILLAISLMNHAVHWWDGSLPVGTFDLGQTADSLFPVYFLALTHYLNIVARRALDAFHPVLEISESDFLLMRYRLTTVPAAMGYLAAAAGVLLGIFSVRSGPANFGISANSSTATLLYTYGRSIFTSAVGAAFVYHTIHQLRLISIIHGQAPRITIFQSIPLHAFSTLSARTGIGLILFSSYVLLLNTRSGLDNVSITVVAVLILTAVAAFILPLNSMHRRLVLEKTRLTNEANHRLENMIVKFHQQVDAGDLDNIGNLTNAMNGLIATQDLLNKISTWPWKPETIRGFLTAVLLPITLYFLTRILGNLLHL